MSNRFDALVIGAGMVGATAALAFARKGYRVALMERMKLDTAGFQPQQEIDLRVSAISPDSQRLLSELGVWPEVHRQRSCDYHHMRVWHQNGTTQMNFSAEQIAFSHLGTIVENRHVQAVLLQQLSYLDNVTLFGHCKVDGIEQINDAVKVTTDGQQEIEAALVLAADGRQSSVRQLLDLPVIGGDYRQSAIVANVKTELPHQHTAWQRFLSTGPLAFLPLWDGRSSIVWSADSERAAELMALSDDDFRMQLEHAFESRLGSILEISQRAAFPLNWHNAQQWLKNRVLLIGDAAHGVHPLAGQGVNLGFADVALLSGLINPGDDIYQPRLLRRFERQRKAEVQTATHLFTLLKQVYGQQDSVTSLLRDLGMSAVEKNGLLKRLVMQSALHNMS